jgi:(E)-4-hydroxy-3-methylbut-2-enyl-diphosphate synthase
MITREIKIGDLALGGKNPVRVQGMLKSSFDEPQKLLEEAKDMVSNGAEIIRVDIKRWNLLRFPW